MNHIKQSAYLNKCDLISKYNVKSINEISSVLRLDLYVKSWEYLESSKSDLKSTNFEENSQIKSILLVYILNVLSPSIKTSKKVEISNNKPLVKNLGYLLKTSVSEKKNISNILNWLFVENVSQIVISGWNSKLIKKDKSKITLSFMIPFHVLKESEDFGANYLKDISLKNINLHIDLILDNKINNFNLNTLFPFWING
jgi:hypothetical protein